VTGAVYAAGAALSRPLSDAATVAVAAPGLVVVVLACLRDRYAGLGTRRPRTARTVLAWAAVVALFAAWDLAAWLQQPAYNVASYDHPTISLLLDPVLEPWPVRFAAWCGWLYVGWRLVRR
jgi:hypothetical protein